MILNIKLYIGTYFLPCIGEIHDYRDRFVQEWTGKVGPPISEFQENIEKQVKSCVIALGREIKKTYINTGHKSIPSYAIEEAASLIEFHVGLLSASLNTGQIMLLSMMTGVSEDVIIDSSNLTVMAIENFRDTLLAPLQEAGHETVPDAENGSEFVFTKVGANWHCIYEGITKWIKHVAGMYDYHFLISRQGDIISDIELINHTERIKGSATAGQLQGMSDAEKKKIIESKPAEDSEDSYREEVKMEVVSIYSDKDDVVCHDEFEKLKLLKEARRTIRYRIDEAQYTDLDMRDKDLDDLKSVKREIKNIEGYDPKSGRNVLRSAAPTSKARSAVKQRMNTALKNITEVHPKLSMHLEESVVRVRGKGLKYNPSRSISWKI